MNGRYPADQPVDCRVFVLDLDAQLGNRERDGLRQACGQRPETDAILLRSQKRHSSSSACFGKQVVEVARTIHVVVGESGAGSKTRSCRLEPLKELLRPRNTAESGDRPVNWRDFHTAAQAPDRPLPASQPAAIIDLLFNIAYVCGYRDHIRTLCRTQRLPQVSRGEQAIGEVTAAQQQDVDVACELAVLKPIVKQMDANLLIVIEIGFIRFVAAAWWNTAVIIGKKNLRQTFERFEL